MFKQKLLIGLLLCTHSLVYAKLPYLNPIKKTHLTECSSVFDDLMGYCFGRQNINMQKKRSKPITLFCKDLYEKNNLERVSPQKDPIIPKIVHLIWVGPKTPPPVFQKCLESINEHLPTWELKLWTDKDVPTLKLYNKKYYDEETNYGAKADILRYELLYQFGGLYLDVDMVVQKPLDILNHTYEFYVGLETNFTPAVIGNALIASVAGHSILKECIENIKHSRNSSNILYRTGPMHFQESFFKVVRERDFPRVVALPAAYFYPHPRDPRDETFTVHHWAGSWVEPHQ